MKFDKNEPKVDALTKLKSFKRFLQLGQEEFCEFLKRFLNIDDVRVQVCDLSTLKAWLSVESVEEVMKVSDDENEICIVSQIKTKDELIAYFPYVLRGKNVKTYFQLKSFLPKLAEAISDQITLCYLQDFIGGDWIFGENLARMIVANCISTRKYDGVKFTHLIEKMEQLATASFEGSFFPTGVIVTNDSSKYKKNFFAFETIRNIDNLDKREWFLANGQESFFLLDSNKISRGIFRKSIDTSSDFITRYFDDYYLKHDLHVPDFIVRTVGLNEISVSNSDGKEFVKVENVWKYRHHKSFTTFLFDKLNIKYKICYAILMYTLKCSRNHVSSIIWIPKDCSDENIFNLTTDNRVRIWKNQLNLLNESHQVLIEKILESDGAIVIDNHGKVLYESVFADMSKRLESKETKKLVGSGETAARLLSTNGVAIKISQDGTIKIFSGDEIIYY